METWVDLCGQAGSIPTYAINRFSFYTPAIRLHSSFVGDQNGRSAKLVTKNPNQSGVFRGLNKSYD
jgi:hypothetical protein